MIERDIFQAALAIADDAARRDYLASACAGDEGLVRRVEILLHAHEGARLFLERPIFAGPTGPSGPGADRAGEGEGEDEDDPTLDCLAPTTRPGALGRLGHYEVLEVLGRGGFGTVVRAFDEKLHRVVAIKVMARGLAATSPARRRFLREARAAAAVRHEHVVGIHAVEEHPVPYLVMEYVAGPTLQEVLDRSGPIAAPEVLRIGRQVAEGLAAAHGRGLVHRDIKPANILLEDGVDRVRITDFGLARAADDASPTQSGFLAGTPLYMAPEQALGRSVDRRADLFSLGSVLYVMATGRPPFRAPSALAVLRRVAEDSPRPIREIVPEVPVELCTLIDRLHAKDPAARFGSAREVADLLLGLLDPPPPLAGPAVAPPRPVPPGKARPVDPDFDAPATPRPRWLAAGFWASAAAVVAALILAEAGGISRFRAAAAFLFEGRGTLTVQLANPAAEVTIVGEGVSIRSQDDQPTREFRLIPGRYALTVLKDQRVLDNQVVAIKAYESRSIRIGETPRPAGDDPLGSFSPLTQPPPEGSGPWDPLVDPAGGSRVEWVGDRLTLTVPGGGRRHLNPMPGFNLDAPRCLQEVDGDFSIQVAQLPTPRPEPDDADKARDLDGYRWAGLVVWADDRNLFRFGVGRHPEFHAGAPFLDLKLHRDVRMADEVVRYTDDGTTHLRVVRRGDKLHVRTSRDGRAWTDFKVCDVAGFPARFRVGFAAINCGTQEYRAQLEGLALEPDGRVATGAAVAGRPAYPRGGAWGRLVDPLGGSRATLDGGRLVVNLPGGASRDLNPGPSSNLNAPRLWQPVDGNFTARVAVPPLPEPRPGASHTGDGNTDHWAGLVVWADGRDFVRLGVGRSTVDAGAAPSVHLESFRDGRPVQVRSARVPAGTTHLLAQRRGDTLAVKYSFDGRNWVGLGPVALAGLPATLQVGVAAINTGSDPVDLAFDGWRIGPETPPY